MTHHIDAYSPLAPHHLRENVNVVRRHGLPLREVDRMTENVGGIPCPVCGETYGTFENLNRHINYSRLLENKDEILIQGSHRDTTLITPNHLRPFSMTQEDIMQALIDKEIIFVCEGIEPLVSGTFQALQSYKLENIVFGGRCALYINNCHCIVYFISTQPFFHCISFSRFAPCMSQKNGKIYVDLEQFHEIIPNHHWQDDRSSWEVSSGTASLQPPRHQRQDSYWGGRESWGKFGPIQL